MELELQNPAAAALVIGIPAYFLHYITVDQKVHINQWDYRIDLSFVFQRSSYVLNFSSDQLALKLFKTHPYPWEVFLHRTLRKRLTVLIPDDPTHLSQPGFPHMDVQLPPKFNIDFSTTYDYLPSQGLLKRGPVFLSVSDCMRFQYIDPFEIRIKDLPPFKDCDVISPGLFSFALNSALT